MSDKNKIMNTSSNNTSQSQQCNNGKCPINHNIKPHTPANVCENGKCMKKK